MGRKCIASVLTGEGTGGRGSQPMRRPRADGAGTGVAASQGTPVAGRSWKGQGRGPPGEPTRRRLGHRRGHVSPLCQATQFVGAGVSPGSSCTERATATWLLVSSRLGSARGV